MTLLTKAWTAHEVADRFEEAAMTLRRLPPVHVQGYYSNWPPIIRTVAELWHEEHVPRRIIPPSAEAISRMEHTIQWVFWLDEEELRRLVWLRAENVRWRAICEYLGCGRTKAWQMWVMALLTIATRLNSMQAGDVGQ